MLEKARDNCAENEKALRYLSDISWQIGHFPLARSIDKEFQPEKTRKQKGFLNEIYLNYIYDWVEDRPDWYQAGLTYVHHFRPDINAGFSFEEYKRNDMYDHQIGLSLSYRLNMNLSFEYQSYFSTDRNFLANQKHHPILYYSFPSFTVIGAGVRLDEYKNGWAEIARFDIRQYIRSFYGEYTLLTGQDNFDRSVTTHIAKVGYEKEEKFFCHIGYSNGDETIEMYGGSNFSDQRIESLFFNFRYFVNAKWGIILAGGPEYRDSKLYRTTGAISLFMRF
jgi:YaiO family outer membrane protein